MGKYTDKIPNYDKYPYIRVTGRVDDCLTGRDAVCGEIKRRLAATDNPDMKERKEKYERNRKRI